MVRRRVGGKREGTYGAWAKNHPRTIRALVDYDYLPKLSREELQFLADFSDNHYGADFRKDRFNYTPEQRRERYRAKNHANEDAWEIAKSGNALLYRAERETWHPGDPTPEAGTTPGYLNSQEYRAALAAYRALLPERGAPRDPESPELAAAYARLQKAKHA